MKDRPACKMARHFKEPAGRDIPRRELIAVSKYCLGISLVVA
jgi:hypothetical protein